MCSNCLMNVILPLTFFFMIYIKIRTLAMGWFVFRVSYFSAFHTITCA